MNENTTNAVIAALSEGLDAQHHTAFEAGCRELMGYSPTNLDQANFLKLSLPIYTRIVHCDPRKVDEATKVGEFLDQRAIVDAAGKVVLIGIDVEAAMYASLAEKYLNTAT